MARPDDERPGSGSHWVKSSLSFSNGNCVEVANLSESGVAVRNSRDPEGPVLRFTPDEWHAFLGGARLGEFDSFGRLRSKSREQRRVLPDGPGGPSAAASPQIASSPAGPSAGWRKSPAYGAGSRLRCGRRAAACAGACREYGEPPGALRLTVPTFCTPADRGRLPVAASGRTGRDPLGYVQKPCSARRAPASIGVWPSARAKCVSAPEGAAARRCRLHAPGIAGTGVPRREVRAGAGHRFAGEETAPLQVNRKTRRNSVHAVPSVGCRGRVLADRAPTARGEVRAPGGSSSSSRCSTNTSASCGARHRSPD